jgi:flagellar hook assembly protein FlgD
MQRATPIRSGWLAFVILAGLVQAAAAGLISDTGAIPSPFSPNADGVYDSTAVFYTLSDTAAVVVSVADSTLSEILMLWSGWENPGEHRHWWDGSEERAMVPDGDYYFLIQAIPQEGGPEDVEIPVAVDTEAPIISDLSAVPNRFTPDGDGVADSVAVSLEVDYTGGGGQVSVVVRDLQGEEVDELFSSVSAESVLVHWDGISSDGTESPDALYSVDIEARDPAGNVSQTELLIDLDLYAPYLGVIYPDSTLTEVRVNDTLAVVNGWAYDRAGVTGVELSLDQVDWVEISFSGPDTVWWEQTLTCTDCVPDSSDGTLAVYVRGHDGVATADGEGHVNGTGSTPPLLSFVVTFDVAGPSHIESTIQDDDNVYYPGQTITIWSEWDDDGYDVEADFSGVDSNFDPEEVQVSGSATGVYTVIYTVSSNAITPVSAAQVRIEATDHFERSLADSSVTVILLAGSGEPSGLSLDRNFFNPAEGDVLEVNLGSYSGEIVIEIFNMTGSLVRRLEASDAQSLTWNGCNDGGRLVASGVYFLSIVTDEGNAVRKVAVIK